MIDTIYVNMASADTTAYVQFWSDVGMGFKDVAPFVWGVLSLYTIVKMLYSSLG